MVVSVGSECQSALPEGFEWIRSGPWRIALRSDHREALVAAGIGEPATLAAGGGKHYAGRGRPVRVELAGGVRAVLRRYLHGGLMRALTRGWFAGAPRPLRELAATEHARRAGVRAPEVLAAVHRTVAGFLHEGYILTREVAGSTDLVVRLEAGEPVGAALRSAGRQTRRLHDCGVWHADLHVKNVLDVGGSAWLIDFDRARVMACVPEKMRRQNLLRFARSLEKLHTRGVAISRTDRLRFFAGYYEDGVDRDESRELARDCRRMVARHRIGWRGSEASR